MRRGLPWPRSGAESSIGLTTQALDHGRWVVGAVDGRSSDEDVSAGVRATFDRLRRDAAVDLEPDGQVGAPDEIARPPDLRNHDVEKRLAAEARLDGHHENEVELGEQFRIRIDRRGGPQRQT